MSVLFYFWTLIFVAIVLFVVALVVFTTILTFVFRWVDKRKVAKGKRDKPRSWGKCILISFLISLGPSVLVGAFILTEQYQSDEALGRATSSSSLSLPFYYVTDVDFPQQRNDGDDFCVNKTLHFFYSPSASDIEDLEKLCKDDERWTKVGNKYCFRECVFESERSYEVEIEGDEVKTTYLKW